MSAIPSTFAQHPQFVPIPDSSTQGIRAYREPEQPHPLQLTFLDPAGELAWIDHVRGLLASGRADEADACLADELAGFDGSLARLCKATASSEIVLEGWENLLPTLSEWEGPPATAITIGLTNPPDLVFEAGPSPEPDLLVCLYSDEAFAFSRTSTADILTEFRKNAPAWIDGEEDIEFHCRVTGLEELNRALINCKHRYFLRDGRDGAEGRAPGGYVEYVLGCWLLATRFLQALTHAVSEHGAPAGCVLIAGTVDINADFVAVIRSDKSSPSTPMPRQGPQPSFASLTAKRLPPRTEPVRETGETSLTLRQRLKSVEPAPAEKQRGFLTRLFGRFRTR